MAHQVLFVCTGNYYRSRFAELLFNALAAQAALPWTATSRGFILAPQNVGPISPMTLAELARRGVAVAGDVRAPLVVQEADLAVADLIVALKEAEHRPWFQRSLPAWTDRVEYWHIHDADVTPPAEALAQIAHEVEALIGRLAVARGAATASAMDNSAS